MAEDRQISGPMHSRPLVIGALGVAQTLAWGSSYYLPAILAGPISAGVGVPQSWVFAAFSGALLLAAFAGPAVGRIVDRHGGGGVLAASNIVLAAGLVALAAANGPVLLFAAWAILGVGMALGLYDTAFAALTALYGRDTDHRYYVDCGFCIELAADHFAPRLFGMARDIVGLGRA